MATRQRVWDACEHGRVPRGGPGGAGGFLPGPFGRGRAVDEVHRWRTAGGAKQSTREERDGGEGLSAISKIPGTSR